MEEECVRHAELVKRVEQNEKDIRRLDSKNSDMSVQLVKQDTKLDFITDMVKDLKDNVKKLTEQPAKRWDTLITAGITCLVSVAVSGVVAFAFRH